MTYRWIGAVLILAGCGGFGFSMAAEHRRQERILRDLQKALKFMQWELQYRLTPLPDLCLMAGKQAGGPVGQILIGTGKELRRQIRPDVNSCMQAVLAKTEGLPRFIRLLLRRMGGSLGRFDLAGQLEGLEALSGECSQEALRLAEGRTQRLRSYETLGLCAGAAAAILLI